MQIGPTRPPPRAPAPRLNRLEALFYILWLLTIVLSSVVMLGSVSPSLLILWLLIGPLFTSFGVVQLLLWLSNTFYRFLNKASNVTTHVVVTGVGGGQGLHLNGTYTPDGSQHNRCLYKKEMGGATLWLHYTSGMGGQWRISRDGYSPSLGGDSRDVARSEPGKLTNMLHPSEAKNWKVLGADGLTWQRHTLLVAEEEPQRLKGE